MRVRLFRDWGRPSEKQESFTIELKAEDDGAMKVGRFVIGRGSRGPFIPAHPGECRDPGILELRG